MAKVCGTHPQPGQWVRLGRSKRPARRRRRAAPGRTPGLHRFDTGLAQDRHSCRPQGKHLREPGSSSGLRREGIPPEEQHESSYAPFAARRAALLIYVLKQVVLACAVRQLVLAGSKRNIADCVSGANVARNLAANAAQLRKLMGEESLSAAHLRESTKQA